MHYISVNKSAAASAQYHRLFPCCLMAISQHVNWSSARSWNTSPAEIYDSRFVSFGADSLALSGCLVSPPPSCALILHESQPLLLFIAPCMEGLKFLATFPLKEKMPTWLQYIWGRAVYSACIMPYCHAENSFFLFFLSSFCSVCLSFVTNPSTLVYFLFYAPYFLQLFAEEGRIRSQCRVQTVVKIIHPLCAS